MDALQIRKTQVTVAETRLVLGRGDDGPPLRKVVAGAIIRNPLARQGWVDDLTALIEPSAALGDELGRLGRDALGEPVESYGKAAIAGLDGEQEHANACLTSAYGDALRAAVGGGRAWITSATKVAGAGTPIDVPLAFKDEIWVRSHYDAVEAWFPDAPAPDEIVVIAALANRGRIGARLGGMSRDEAQQALS